MEERTYGQEWEAEVMEQLAEIREAELLDIAQGIAALLTGDLTKAKSHALAREPLTLEELDMLRVRIGNMAVMLDVLQLRYGDAAEHEQSFLGFIENSFKQ